MLNVTGSDCMEGMLAEQLRHSICLGGAWYLHCTSGEAQQHELESSREAAGDPMNIA